MLSGTPLEIACTPKPWRRPLGERCGPAGMSAACITAVTWRQAVIRLHGRMRHTGISDDVLPPVEMVHVFSVRDGRIEWNYICAGLEEALAAARERAAAASGR